MSEGVGKVLRNYVTTLTNTVSVLAVSVTEVLISQNVFICPCHPSDTELLVHNAPSVEAAINRSHYAIVFILWPAVGAFFLAVMASGRMLRCLIEHRYRTCNMPRHCRAVRYGFENASSILIPPGTWLFVALMDGGYYTCAVGKAPDHCLPAVATLNATLAQRHLVMVRENEWHRSVSQIIALTMVGAAAVITALVVICGQIFSTFPYYKRKYMKLYRDKEMETFETVSETSLKTALTTKWEKFFREADVEDWETISALPVGSPYLHKGHHYYSAFHAWPLEVPKPLTYNTRPTSATSTSKVTPTEKVLLPS